jgi:predicted nucleotidyltransferase component of viral defense system
MNIAASVRARLANIARKENIAFQVIIVRYLHERLLYRLSRSRFADRFFLKGGNFIYAIGGLTVRPTKDIDFLGHAIPDEADEIGEMFAEIAATDFNDGVWYDVKNIHLEQITEQNRYNGIRMVFPAGFDTIKTTIQIDIGFGDHITPKAVKLQYPVLLADMPAPDLLAYTTETVIAEKFQAMIALAGLNSRMKDFYDVYLLLSSGNNDLAVLKEAISATFENRDTRHVQDHILFTPDFATDNTRNRMWQAFLKKIGQPEMVPFTQVMRTIAGILEPIWESLNNRDK